MHLVMVGWRLFRNTLSPRAFPSPVPLRGHTVRLVSTVPTSRIASLLHDRQSSVEGNVIKVNGFIRSVRKQKRVAFAALGDGSSLESLQVVFTPGQAEGLSTGLGVTVTGLWQPSPSGKQQQYELHAQEVQILGQNDPATYPLQKKYHSPEFLRTLPHLRMRLPFNSLLLRLRSRVIADASAFFSRRDFVQTHPPIITSSDCEGAGEVFAVSTEIDGTRTMAPESGAAAHDRFFFRSPKYLTVSSQLHLEAFAQSVGNVWTLSPTFRAEKSDTPRHLSEFYMLEAEMTFVDGLDEIMVLVEELLRDIAQNLQNSKIGKELLSACSSLSGHEDETAAVTQEELARRWQGLIDRPWPRITYSKAIEHLEDAMARKRASFKFPPSFGSGLQAEHERYLAEVVGQGSPLFVTDYPRDTKAFYMASSAERSLENGAAPTVACFDLLVPEICELVGGSLREHRLPELLEAMERRGMTVPYQFSREADGEAEESARTSRDSVQKQVSEGSSNLNWYLDLRRYGSVPHGGFGIGFDRLLCYLSGVTNLREIVGFPRWHGRCDC